MYCFFYIFPTNVLLIQSFLILHFRYFFQAFACKYHIAIMVIYKFGLKSPPRNKKTCFQLSNLHFKYFKKLWQYFHLYFDAIPNKNTAISIFFKQQHVYIKAYHKIIIKYI
ncbi:hypothetical protein EDEG_03307 [Edhazardia aedis USNM 41457]|uniref:Uncharacterized protein n=1 Tax=Edhazardia aedis (strain USNM 41457) TaxID=1003232 RepID=J9D348_EDHAE|nr:hypothetical protein EDEG_03307 [Edhazardia aedis USNM 41457]|eukprot:EJW02256.1 hypothetical protein EDEG_03307 [Edhazardia aedis USNM 41457]